MTSTTPRGRVPVADSDYNERLLRNVRDARGFRHVPQSERELAQTPAQIRRIRYLRERHAARQRRHSAAGEVTAGKENLDAHAAEVRAAIERLEENRTQQIQERRSTRRAERALQIIEERFSKKIERQ